MIGAGMSDERNEEICRRWFQEVWNEGRLATIDELMAPDGVAHDVTGKGVDLSGPSEFKAAASAMRAAFEDIKLEVLDVFSSKNKVAMRLNVTLTHTGPLGHLPPTGARVSTPVMCIIHMRDGQIIEGWNYWDIASVLQAAAAPSDQRALV